MSESSVGSATELGGELDEGVSQCCKSASADLGGPRVFDLGVLLLDDRQEVLSARGESDHPCPVVRRERLQSQVALVLEVAEDPVERLLGQEGAGGQLSRPVAFRRWILEHSQVGGAAIAAGSARADGDIAVLQRLLQVAT